MKNIIYFIVISTILLINSCIEEPPNALITGVGGVVTDANNIPLEGVEVSVGSKKELTDAKGYYMIDGVSGTISLTAVKQGYAKYNYSVTSTNGVITKQNIKLIKLGSIVGKVTGNNGVGIEGVKISTIPATEEVNTDANGNYTIADLTAGNYTVKAEKNGYYTSSKQVTVIEGAETENNFTLYLEGTVPEGMVIVEGGTFQMGSTIGGSDEKPVHNVTLSSFYISKYEVTQGKWRAVMGTNPSNWSGDNLPVEGVSWYDAVEYCNKLSEAEGLEKFYTISGSNVIMNWGTKGYRLPTEAEWEYACRGGIHSASYTYSGSDNIDDVAWYSGNSGSKTHEVGTKSPNELGIYDMSGNVLEWCNDWYSSSYYGSSPSNDPRGPNSGAGRVIRGGSWDYYAVSCRSANRDGGSPGYSYNDLGFRIVRTP